MDNSQLTIINYLHKEGKRDFHRCNIEKLRAPIIMSDDDEKQSFKIEMESKCILKQVFIYLSITCSFH
jgi:hypothetical protein